MQKTDGTSMDMPGPDLDGIQAAFRYLDVLQKQLKMKPFDVKKLYEGLVSSFLTIGRCFERQIVLAQSACRLPWLEDVKVDLFERNLEGMAKR